MCGDEDNIAAKSVMPCEENVLNVNLTFERPTGVNGAMRHYVSTPVMHSVWQKHRCTSKLQRCIHDNHDRLHNDINDINDIARTLVRPLLYS
jgi:hypothetical protein